MNPAAWTPLPQHWRDRAFEQVGTILLESTLPSTEQHRSWLFERPAREIVLRGPDGLDDFFQQIDHALAEGLHLAGFFTYEFGAALLGLSFHSHTGPLAHLGVYTSPSVFDHLAPASGPVNLSRTSIKPLRLAALPLDARADYLANIETIQQWIAAGETYQLNFTTALQSTTEENARQIFQAVAEQQPCSYAAIIALDPTKTMLSFSPELFLSTDDFGQITTRPIKGTAPRSSKPHVDRALAEGLARDEKNRAEHVMIVDLLRNDLGRICRMGSIAVDGLFTVESFPTIHQMTSTVRGQLVPHSTWRQILEATFPSGSITGAPKRHTIGLIHKVETRPRGVYTGAIGHIAPDGSSTFSVAIRTLLLQHATSAHKATGTRQRNATVTLGIGSGIVADSLGTAEYKECLLKANFIHRASEPLHVVETMRSTGPSLPWLDLHLARLRKSALDLEFDCDCDAIGQALLDSVSTSSEHELQRVRLTLSPEGGITIAKTKLEPWPAALRIRIAPKTIYANDPARRHKTTFRHLYDETFERARRDGFDEALFTNTRGELTEGCITNLFILQGDRLLTPPLAAGVLHGVLRGQLMQLARAEEKSLDIDSLQTATAVMLGNSIRGLCPVESILQLDGTVLRPGAAHADAQCKHLNQVLGIDFQ